MTEPARCLKVGGVHENRTYMRLFTSAVRVSLGESRALPSPRKN